MGQPKLSMTGAMDLFQNEPQPKISVGRGLEDSIGLRRPAQERGSLDFEAFQFRSGLLIGPSHSDSDASRGFAAAGGRPAAAQGHRYSPQQHIAQRDRALPGEGIGCLRHDMFGMLAKPGPQVRAALRDAGYFQRSFAVPFHDATSRRLAYASGVADLN